MQMAGLTVNTFFRMRLSPPDFLTECARRAVTVDADREPVFIRYGAEKFVRVGPAMRRTLPLIVYYCMAFPAELRRRLFLADVCKIFMKRYRETARSKDEDK